MKPILVSACLLGMPVRWDGKIPSSVLAPVFAKFVQRGGSIIAVCPECAGGLPTPRDPCEIRGGDGSAVLSGRARVESRTGADRTLAYVRGAREALALCLGNRIRVAVLRSKSPSCGTEAIYDGTFSGALAPGAGVAAALLRESGVRVYDESHVIEALAEALREEDCGNGCCGCSESADRR